MAHLSSGLRGSPGWGASTLSNIIKTSVPLVTSQWADLQNRVIKKTLGMLWQHKKSRTDFSQSWGVYWQ